MHALPLRLTLLAITLVIAAGVVGPRFDPIDTIIVEGCRLLPAECDLGAPLTFRHVTR